MRLLGLVSLAVLALLIPGVATAPGSADSAVDARRAVTSYEAMQRRLFDSRTGAYREDAGGKANAHAWPASQALAATVAVAALPLRGVAAKVPDRIRAFERIFRSGSTYVAWPGGDVYFDDNAWAAGTLLDWSELSGDKAAAARASSLFAQIVRAWDPDQGHPCVGGIFWTEAAGNRDRNTVTTANAALLALRLYGSTKRADYLVWAGKLLAWEDRCMLGTDNLYADHIGLDGSVDETRWSYNQGLLIGAFVELYAITGDTGTLVRAEQVGDAALAYFGDRWDGGEPPEFAAIFFRQLLALAAVDQRQDYVDAAEGYARQAWSTARDARTGLFSFSGKTRLLDQAAFVQLYAALARQPVTTGP